MYKYLQLYACCFAVKGYMRGIIYDAQRFNFDFVPNGLISFIEKSRLNDIESVKQNFGNENTTIIDEYIHFLIEKEYAFFCSEAEKEFFPPISALWQTPCYIENAVINCSAIRDIDNIFKRVNELNCRHILLILKAVSIENLLLLLGSTKEKRFSSIGFWIEYDSKIAAEQYQKIMNDFVNINFIILYGAIQDKLLSKSIDNIRVLSMTVKQPSIEHTKPLTPSDFVINTYFFIESQNFHPIFNRKMGIDIHGNIKNCPSLSESFGNINDPDIDLRAIAQSPAFQRLWTVRKDDTAVCRDCEFRYMCVDSREPHLGNDGLYYHRSPCPYDPYTATWRTQES